MSAHERTSEARESLWALVVPPLIWAAHFLASYITAAVWCAKAAEGFGSLGPARIAIAIYTAVALLALALLARRGWRRHGHQGGSLPHDEDSALSRYRFLGWAAFLLSMLGLVAVAFAAITIVFVGDCR